MFPPISRYDSKEREPPLSSPSSSTHSFSKDIFSSTSSSSPPLPLPPLPFPSSSTSSSSSSSLSSPSPLSPAATSLLSLLDSCIHHLHLSSTLSLPTLLSSLSPPPSSDNDAVEIWVAMREQMKMEEEGMRYLLSSSSTMNNNNNNNKQLDHCIIDSTRSLMRNLLSPSSANRSPYLDNIIQKSLSTSPPPSSPSAAIISALTSLRHSLSQSLSLTAEEEKSRLSTLISLRENEISLQKKCDDMNTKLTLDRKRWEESKAEREREILRVKNKISSISSSYKNEEEQFHTQLLSDEAETQKLFTQSLSTLLAEKSKLLLDNDNRMSEYQSVENIHHRRKHLREKEIHEMIAQYDRIMSNREENVKEIVQLYEEEKKEKERLELWYNRHVIEEEKRDREEIEMIRRVRDHECQMSRRVEGVEDTIENILWNGISFPMGHQMISEINKMEKVKNSHSSIGREKERMVGGNGMGIIDNGLYGNERRMREYVEERRREKEEKERRKKEKKRREKEKSAGSKGKGKGKGKGKKGGGVMWRPPKQYEWIVNKDLKQGEIRGYHNVNNNKNNIHNDNDKKDGNGNTRIGTSNSMRSSTHSATSSTGGRASGAEDSEYDHNASEVDDHDERKGRKMRSSTSAMSSSSSSSSLSLGTSGGEETEGEQGD